MILLRWGVTALSSGILGLVSDITSLEKAHLGIDKAEKTLDSSHKKLLTSQDALNKAIAKYGADTRQAEIAQLGLDAATKRIC